MKRFIKTIILLAFTAALFSCNDKFLNEVTDISGVATSAIVISPQWDAADYEFKLEGVKEADFTVMSKPAWLSLDTPSGKFQDSIATIHCAAIAEPAFSNIGFYVDQIMVMANGKNYAVPVYYITEGNPAVKVNRTLEIASTDYNNQLLITNEGEGILLWDIVSMPTWLTVNMSQINPSSLILPKGTSVQVPFSFNLQSAVQNNLKGTIVVQTNDRNNPLVEIAVTADLGKPNLTFLNYEMNLGSTETTKTTNIYNHGSGILVWNFEGLPEWLTVDHASGIVMPYAGSEDLTFTCHRSSLQPGLNTATFYLKSNDPDQPSMVVTIQVRVPGTGVNIRPLEGNIIDATFDKSTNTLYYVTGQPNKLVAYDVTNRIILNETELTKAPTCMGIDENFRKAVIGQGGQITIVDLASFQVSKSYVINTTVFDAEWASDTWFCYTNANSSANLSWMNAETGEKYLTPFAAEYTPLGTANLKKVPNQPYIIGNRKNVSPEGIYVFDIETRKQKSYTHTTIGNVWFLNQNELMATGISSIIRTAVVTGATGNQIQGPSAIGELKISEYANMSWWLDYSEAKHSIWALLSYYIFTYYPPVKGKIYQFEDNDYTLVKTYTYDYMYQPEAQTAAYEVEARYVFANNAGTELTLLRKGADNNNWSVEFMAVP